MEIASTEKNEMTMLVLREVLGWEPSIRLEQGLAATFEWIAAQVLSKAPVFTVVSAAAD